MTLPALFIGHGSPMNAIADNSFTRALHAVRGELGEPKAVLVVSAHWVTRGTWVTHMAAPPTIHDFGGFPQALFDVRYPAPGSAEVAKLVRSVIPSVQFDDTEWGLDHGTWSVLRHVYPEAKIPVLQLSLDLSQPASYHLELGRRLGELREKGILIVGSGNVVHNLRKILREDTAPAYSWALEFDGWVKQKLEARDFAALANDYLATEAGRLSVPTPEHYVPLLYILGAARKSDRLITVHEEMQNGSVSLRTFFFHQ
jgi:4,5-DOPA dioxygenase extradiol